MRIVPRGEREAAGMKLNVGCGRDYRPGWVNIDISDEVKAEAYLDIREDLLCADGDEVPIDDGTVDEIYCSGVLEQIGPNEQLIHAMNEMHRVLKPAGRMEIVVPNARYPIAHRDPMDVRKFTLETFQYFHADAREHQLYGSVYGFLPWSSIVVNENSRHIFTAVFTK